MHVKSPNSMTLHEAMKIFPLPSTPCVLFGFVQSSVKPCQFIIFDFNVFQNVCTLTPHDKTWSFPLSLSMYVSGRLFMCFSMSITTVSSCLNVSFVFLNVLYKVFLGTIHSTKISRNFDLKLNGLVKSKRKSFEKISPPFEVDHFCWLDRSDQNGLFHLTILTHSQSQDFAVQYLPCAKWRKVLITALLWIVNSRSIGVTCTSMFS